MTTTQARSSRNQVNRHRRGMPHTRELRDNISDVRANLRGAAAHAVPAVKEQAGRVGESVAQTTHSVEKTVTTYIREQPIYSVLIAAAVGLFAGMVWLRR